MIAAAKLVECGRCHGTGKLPQLNSTKRVQGILKEDCWQCGGHGKLYRQDRGTYPLHVTCCRPMRGERICVLDKDHPGRHASTGFRCDDCGKMRRSRPYAVGDWDQQHCFMCARVEPV